MMNPTLKVLFLYLSILTAQTAFAFDAKIDGIYYLLDTDAKTATVTYYLYKSEHNWSAYRGDVVIPEVVTYNDETYTVNAIDDYAFYECNYLYSIVIPRSIGRWGANSFQWCSRLTSLTIYSPMIAAQNIATIFGKQVTTVVYGEGIPRIGGCRDCKVLVSVSLPSTVTSIPNQAFMNCESLYSVTLPDNVMSIGRNAFFGCSALGEITLPNNVDTIKYETFAGCSNLTSITIPSSVTCIEGRAFSGCKSMASIIIPSNVTTISYETFQNCSRLTHVTIPEGLTSIGSGAFSGCSSLPSVTIPESVTSIGSSAFSGCSGFTSVILPNSVTSISARLFYDCTRLQQVSFSSSITSIGDEAFRGCTSLKTLSIPEGIKNIGRESFENCSNLNAISIPSSLTSIGRFAFMGCSKLAQVHISDLSAWCEISFELPQIIELPYANFSSNPLFLAHHLYLNEEEIKVLNIPESTNYINNAAFVGCTSLTSVIIPEGCNQIRSYAFYGCSNLSSIYIPSTLSGIGENALPERSIHLYVDGISDALISLWNYLKYGQAISIIDKQSNTTLPRPYLTNVSTASSITLSVQNYYPHFAYTIVAGDSTMQYAGQDFKITGLMPRQSLTVSFAISSNSSFAS